MLVDTKRLPKTPTTVAAIRTLATPQEGLPARSGWCIPTKITIPVAIDQMPKYMTDLAVLDRAEDSGKTDNPNIHPPYRFQTKDSHLHSRSQAHEDAPTPSHAPSITRATRDKRPVLMYPNYSFKPESGETKLSRIEIGRAMIEIGRAMIELGQAMIEIGRATREIEQSLYLVRLIHVRPRLWIWTQSDQVSAR
eukprot:6492806-Amphidinium_carterae.5